MKILITGAAGFIGSQLAYRLWKDKQDLILIDNFSFGHEDNLIFPEHDFREDKWILEIEKGLNPFLWEIKLIMYIT